MMRILVLAAFLALFAAPAMAAETAAAAPAAQPPAATAAKPVDQLNALVLEKAKIAVHLGEIKAFGPFYKNKRERLKPDSERLEKQKTELAVENARITAQCDTSAMRVKRQILATNAKCDALRQPYGEKLLRYQNDVKILRGDYATLDQQEKNRGVQQQEQEILLDEITKQIDTFEKTVPASKQKECIMTCNAGEAPATEQCLQACTASPAP